MCIMQYSVSIILELPIDVSGSRALVAACELKLLLLPISVNLVCDCRKEVSLTKASQLQVFISAAAGKF